MNFLKRLAFLFLGAWLLQSCGNDAQELAENQEIGQQIALEEAAVENAFDVLLQISSPFDLPLMGGGRKEGIYPFLPRGMLG